MHHALIPLTLLVFLKFLLIEHERRSEKSPCIMGNLPLADGTSLGPINPKGDGGFD